MHRYTGTVRARIYLQNSDTYNRCSAKKSDFVVYTDSKSTIESNDSMIIVFISMLL